MSDKEGSEMEVDEQSEDGELNKSPVTETNLPLSKDEDPSYRVVSEEEEEDADDTADSLDIKPPQAAIIHHHKSSSHKKDRHLDRESSRRSRNHPSKSDLHRKSHSHRLREHQDHRERLERHREKHRHRERHEASMRESKRDRPDLGGFSVGREKEGRLERIDSHSRMSTKAMVDRGGQKLLEDLREKLIVKRKGTDCEKKSRSEKRERERRTEEESPVVLVKETPREKAERVEREMRKERLLEADREISRQKEAYRRELEARRERRHLEKEKERTLREIAKKRERSRSRERKKRKVEQDDEKDVEEYDDEDDDEGARSPEITSSSTTAKIVTLSDDSDVETFEVRPQPNVVKSEENRRESHSAERSHEEDVYSSSKDDSESSVTNDDDTEDTEKASEDGYNYRSPDSTEQVKGEISPRMNNKSMSKSDDEKMEEENGLPDDSPKSDIILAEERLPPYLPAISGCRSVEEFQCLNRIEEGTYGVVYRARDKRTEEVVALKKLKMEKEKEGFPITSLREINTLLKAQHPNIVTVREIVVGSNMDKIFIVMDYVEHDLKSLMETMKQKSQAFVPREVKCLMQQLLRAVAHLHDNWILHRDLKTSNLLLSHKGILKVGDFGLAREYGSPLKHYTPIVVTLWYRSPELLLGAKEYSTPVDMWSVGCIFGEFLSMEAMFPGTSEVDQLNKIFKELGTPNENIWPGYSQLPAIQRMTFTEYPANVLRNRFGAIITDIGLDLMNKFLTFHPSQRVTAEDAIKHPYFQEAPLPIDPAMFPTWPAKSELGHRKVAASPKPPSGGREYKQLGDTDDDLPAGGFHMGGVEKGRAAMGGGFSLRF